VTRHSQHRACCTCIVCHAGTFRVFPVEELKTLRKLGTRLQGHPAGIMDFRASNCRPAPLDRDYRSGWNGHCRKLDGKITDLLNPWGWRVAGGFDLEAAMSASHHKLGNLTAIIDRNGLQIDGNTEDVMKLEPLCTNGAVLDGTSSNAMAMILGKYWMHSFNQIMPVKPSVIIAKTIMGKGSGVSKVISGGMAKLIA